MPEGVSLIISVYKNTLFLKAVLDNLRYQTTLPHEVIISEDGDSREMHDFLVAYGSFPVPIVHLTQADEGWRKNRALNRAIAAASHEYLIFIDGDCVLHTRFVQNHIRLARRHHILAGKRIKLGPKYTGKLQYIPVTRFQRGLIWRLPQLKRDGAKFAEEAWYLPMNRFSRALIAKLGISSIKGCNFSCYKEAMLAINGFDEDYVRPAVGEDHDLVWRFEGLGYRMVSVKHFAVQYHLYHPESWVSQEENLVLLRQKQASKQYRCLNGIEKLSS